MRVPEEWPSNCPRGWWTEPGLQAVWHLSCPNICCVLLENGVFLQRLRHKNPGGRRKIDATMDQSEQGATPESFGTLDPGLKTLTRAPERMQHEVLIAISNPGKNGRPVARGDRKRITGPADSRELRRTATMGDATAAEAAARIFIHSQIKALKSVTCRQLSTELSRGPARTR